MQAWFLYIKSMERPMYRVSTKENKNTKIKPKQSIHVESQIRQNKRVALDVHTNKKNNAKKSSWKWEWNSVKMRDKKLTIALLGMLPHNQESHGCQLYFLFYESTRSLLIVCFSPSKPRLFSCNFSNPPS